ncbi:MAG: 2Fe-2S iron-sulfur cluster binding domain-containing protein, partial [Candidatus Cloacimonetes bacterium]|nr:2Fe-2S iron-sulfur cluster binding domain-containing protein [Candidatus Cloacimonadota bacterium]
LNDYGNCDIDINGKKKISVKGGNTLLNTLSDQQIYLASACGGRGSCGACKCKVTTGAGPLLPTEKPLLSAQEQANSIRLACQIKVKSNIAITIPESIFNIRKYKASVTEIIDYTYDIKGVTFKLPEPAEVDFQAGQYMQLESQPYGNVKQRTMRAYSISSKPEQRDSIQLIIRLVPEGICTTWVHKFLKVGDEVNMTGPYGDFFIRDTDSDMIFIAGGSGKAPIKSMLEHLAIAGTKRHMTYFFGARSEQDLYLTEQFQSYESVFEHFHYFPVLSRCDEGSKWCGRTGYIIPYIKEVIRDAKNTEAYMCGSPGMLDACQKELLALGVPRDKIYYDSFG